MYYTDTHEPHESADFWLLKMGAGLSIWAWMPNGNLWHLVKIEHWECPHGDDKHLRSWLSGSVSGLSIRRGEQLVPSSRDAWHCVHSALLQSFLSLMNLCPDWRTEHASLLRFSSTIKAVSWACITHIEWQTAEHMRDLPID